MRFFTLDRWRSANHWRCLLGITIFALCGVPLRAEDSESDGEATRQPELISSVRQLTFAGRRAGEGYFSGDGTEMVFQSERDPSNPFYQIYWMDLETGDIRLISPGQGKTTCAWIHPDGDQVLFASTHEDPEAVAKQQAELELRESGKQRRYSWDYDPSYELYARDLKQNGYRRLTHAKGYDAEGSYSPDGSQIVFASNRDAYSRELTEREQTMFDLDPAYMIDIYIMNADGSDVRRLTDTAGYDGGPFFSPDGNRICWRRFSEDGATAEIFTMKTDGTDVQRLTDLGKMSWAPFYHPSGDYLVFTTNRHGFGNFELYLVRADGSGNLVRVTHQDGFDGLPVFLPDGDRIAWTSNRTDGDRSQIFMGDWDDSEARKLLGLSASENGEADRLAALGAAEASVDEFTAADVGRHVDYLTRRELGGRMTGSPGERRATAYVAAYLESLGYEPAGEDGTFFQTFEFPAGSSLADGNAMSLNGESLVLDQDFRPLAFSGDGNFDDGDVVFAGYGMSVPAAEDQEEYDSYVHLDVRDKWVLVLRDMPQDISAERRQQIARYSTPRRKAAVARDNGARGIIFAAGPTSKVSRELVRFDSAASQANVSIGVLSVSNDVARRMFEAADKDLKATQETLDDGSQMMGFELEGNTVSATVEIERKTGVGRNVLARLPVTSSGGRSSNQMVILGAHIDHLGRGGGSNSLATGDEQDAIHVGADDNASGVAAMLEIAQYLAAQRTGNQLQMKRDLLVAAWSGEELGLFGSQAFVESFYELYPNAPKPDPHAAKSHSTAAQAHSTSTDAQPLTQAVAAYLNLDMVGRLREKLVVQGVGSSPGFPAEVQRRNVPVGIDIQLDKTSTRLPTDASAFVARDVPILSGFTGAHEDYHTPRDTPDKLNYEGITQISKLFALITRGLLTADQAPEFKLEEGERDQDMPRARLTAYLGTIPDYAAGEVKGLKLSGVASDGPAAEAGLKGGDVITELAGKTVENIYDYTYAIEGLKVGETVDVVVQRDGESLRLKITPGSRN